MTLYYMLRQQYDQHMQQAKCLVVFGSLLVPALVAIEFFKTSSAWVYHILLLLTGWFTWTFIEYILHRFYMHRKGANPANKLVHKHHHHHTHPTEIRVTPMQRVLMFIMLLLLTMASYYLLNYFTFFTGLSYGVAGYFTMHKMLHQPWAAKVFRRLFRYHIYHHCKYPNSCYGITVPWWDDMFKTVPQNPQITERIIAFYLGHHH